MTTPRVVIPAATRIQIKDSIGRFRRRDRPNAFSGWLRPRIIDEGAPSAARGRELGPEVFSGSRVRSDSAAIQLQHSIGT